MIIDFGEYGNDEAREYLNSKSKLSLILANKFLEKIPDSIQNTSAARLQDEIAIEGFLFFMMATADGLYQEINNRLCLMHERVVNRNTIVDCLGKNGDQVSRQIKKIIDDVVCKPRWTATEIQGQDIEAWPRDWDRSRSWLWEMANLRNKIMHRSITNRNFYAGLPNGGVKVSLTIAKIDFNEIYYKRADGSVIKLDIVLTNTEKITEDNPAEYFHGCFQKMDRMVSDIQDYWIKFRLVTSHKCVTLFNHGGLTRSE